MYFDSTVSEAKMLFHVYQHSQGGAIDTFRMAHVDDYFGWDRLQL